MVLTGKRAAEELAKVNQELTVALIAREGSIGYNPENKPSGPLPSCVAVAQGTLDAQFTNELVSRFLQSRRQGLSRTTLTFYRKRLTKASDVIGSNTTSQQIGDFLNTLTCTNGGKHSYFRTLRAFYNWLYSPKSGYRLNTQDNPMMFVEPPKLEKRLLPAVTEQDVENLVAAANSLRDKCIVSLFADSGLRLSELLAISRCDIDWETYTVSVIGKGNKQRRAPFTEKTAQLLRAYLADNHNDGAIWGINNNGLTKVLKTLGAKTGIKCNPHSFRRGFACNLHRKGLSTLDIMHLGGWQDLSMVLRYTHSITFDDCLKHYRAVLN